MSIHLGSKAKVYFLFTFCCLLQSTYANAQKIKLKYCISDKIVDREWIITPASKLDSIIDYVPDSPKEFSASGLNFKDVTLISKSDAMGYHLVCSPDYALVNFDTKFDSYTSTLNIHFKNKAANLDYRAMLNVNNPTIGSAYAQLVSNSDTAKNLPVNDQIRIFVLPEKDKNETTSTYAHIHSGGSSLNDSDDNAISTVIVTYTPTL
jgi:hypothetical protein